MRHGLCGTANSSLLTGLLHNNFRHFGQQLTDDPQAG